MSEVVTTVSEGVLTVKPALETDELLEVIVNDTSYTVKDAS